MKRSHARSALTAIGIAVALAGLPGRALAQSSASFQLEQPRLNAGGHPADGVVMSSASHTISLDSIGESVGAVSMASASFTVDSGVISAYRPPTEVAGSCGSGSGPCLTVKRSGPSAVQLSWPFEPSFGTYSVYRDAMSNLSGLGFGACFQSGLTAETATDTDTVAINEASFYLVTVVNPLGETGTKGFRSNGAERLGAVCP
jgi:hypothetical protein